MATLSFDTDVVGNMTGRLTTPSVLDYSDHIATDPTIRSPKEAGTVKTRARFTSFPRQYHIVYNSLTTHDKNLIYEFEKARSGGAEAFNWSRPTAPGSTTPSRFLGLVSYTPWENTNYGRWRVEFDIETTTGAI